MVVGAAILGLLVWRWGTGPFVAGLRLVDGWSLAAAAGIAALTTMCCAWRWKLVSRGLRRRALVPVGGRRLLSLAVPQHRAAGRRPRRCPPRSSARRCGRRRRPRPPFGRVGAHGRAGRAGRGRDRRPVGRPVAGARMDAAAWDRRRRRRARGPAGRAIGPRRPAVAVGEDMPCGRGRRAVRTTRERGMAGRRRRVGARRRRSHGDVPDRRRGRRVRMSPCRAFCRSRCSSCSR